MSEFKEGRYEMASIKLDDETAPLDIAALGPVRQLLSNAAESLHTLAHGAFKVTAEALKVCADFRCYVHSLIVLSACVDSQRKQG